MGNEATTNNSNSRSSWPPNVGIIDLDFYFPVEYVEQTELEAYHGVSKGKYMVGLGQTRMAMCSDAEDINSLCLTVTKKLLEKSNVASKDVGFLMVGTETLIDKSKSIKSVLMELFDEECRDVQGIDTTNACFGGTAALHHAVDWIESSSWDGRLAIVVCADIAVYAEGPARPTGGAGAIAMLLGPNAPLVIDRGVRTHYMDNAWDFYKPDLSSVYPVVDGKLSMLCYMKAADRCYNSYKDKFVKSIVAKEGGDTNITLDTFDGFVFHAPFCKMVQKTMIRLSFNDFLNDPNPDYDEKYAGLKKFRNSSIEETINDKEFEAGFLKACSNSFEKAKPCLKMATEIGNMYTASVYSCLVSYLLSKSANQLAGTRILVFSYGSGLASSMFSIKLSSESGPGSALNKLWLGLQSLNTRLEERIKITPEELTRRMILREEEHNKVPFKPSEDLSILFPGTYYLVEIDEERRRSYKRRPNKV